MKAINLNTHNLLSNLNLGIVDIVFIFKQYVNQIKSYTNTDIVVDGDATTLFTTNDSVLLAFNDFSNTRDVTNIQYDQNNDETTITLTGSNFTDSDLGGVIALKIDVTDRLVKDGISSVEQKVEGNDLFSFDSGDIQITLDNKDGFLFNRNNNGIFNNFDGVFWIKYYIYVKGSNDTVLNYYSAIIKEMTDIQPNHFDRTVIIKGYGHTTELERYPAFLVSEETRNELPKIGGIYIQNYVNSDSSDVGIKNISYKPFNNSRLKSVEVENVSPKTKKGIYVLEFRYPSFFRWNNGDWYNVAVLSDTDNSSGKKKLYDKTGIEYALVSFGDDQQLGEYPDSNVEIWVNVKDDDTENISSNIGNQGEPTLQYDNGTETKLRLHFLAIIKYNSITSQYTEVSELINCPREIDYTSIMMLDNNDDEIIIISDDPFYGIQFELTEYYTNSDISLYHSTGKESFSNTPMDISNNDLDDETNGFTKGNFIKWNRTYNWIENAITVGSVEYKGYMLKIKRNSANGYIFVSEIKRLIRVVGEKGDIIEVSFNQSLLTKKDVDDELIIKQDSVGNYITASWYSNIPISVLLEKALNVSNYSSANRNINGIKIIGNDRTFNIWGKPPKINYTKKPTALYVDYQNNYVYITLDLELWRCEFSGMWEKIAVFSPYTGSQYEYVISDIYKDGDKIVCVLKHNVIMSEFTSIILYCYNIVTGEITIENYNGIITTNILRTNKSFRIGEGYSTPASVFYRGVGQVKHLSNDLYGENIVIPYKQVLYSYIFSVIGHPTLRDAQEFLRHSELLDDIVLVDLNTTKIDWIFTPDYQVSLFNSGNSGMIYNCQTGFYSLHLSAGYTTSGYSVPVNPFIFISEYGQDGIFILINNKLCAFKLVTNIRSGVTLKSYFLYNIVDGTYFNFGYNNISTVPISCTYDDVNDVMYFGHTSYFDSGVDRKSYSYITKCSLNGNRIINADNVLFYDGSGYHNITNECNNDLSLAAWPINSVGDAIYIGSNKKFRTINFVKTGNAEYAIQYYNGVSFVGCRYTVLPNIPNSIISFDIPDDWSLESVNGSTFMYYIKIIRISGNDVINTIGISEYVIFDGSALPEHNSRVPINMLYTKNGIIHGCMFNKDNQQANFPFQWLYFVYDEQNDIYCDNVVSGGNYTYDGTYIFNNLVYSENEDTVYFTNNNIRYKDKSSELLKATYDANFQEITINQVGIPVNTEWGHLKIVSNDDGHIFGLTKDVNNVLWEYAKEYYPRIQIANFSDNDSVRNVIRYINEMFNLYYIIHSERYFRLLSRGDYNNTTNLRWDKNIVKGNPTFNYWENYFDAVNVKYTNPYNDSSGTRKIGYDGWMKKVLSVDNPLIQNKFIAEIIAKRMYDYYNRYRIIVNQLSSVPLLHLECLDECVIYMNPKDVDIDENIRYIITSITLNSDKKLIINALEV